MRSLFVNKQLVLRCNEHLLILLIGRAVCDVIVFVDSRAFQCLQCHSEYDSVCAEVQVTKCQIETWGIDEEEEHKWEFTKLRLIWTCRSKTS